MLVGNIQGEFENGVVDFASAVDLNQMMIKILHLAIKIFGAGSVNIRAVLTANHRAHAGNTVQKVQDFLDRQVFTFADNVRAVFGHKGNFRGNLGEEGFKLEILIAAGDDELDTLL